MRDFKRTLLFFSSLFLCATPNALHAASPGTDDTVAGVTLGTTVDALKATYPKLYSHKLEFGEVLHEACNQDSLDVFTFTEEPWSPGVITYIWVRRETDSTVCRDSTGSLPDYGIAPTSGRGIRIGDSKARIIETYGKPSEEKPVSPDSQILKYAIDPAKAASSLESLVLYFNVRNDILHAISVRGKVPGALAPF